MDSREKNRKLFQFAQEYLETNLPAGLSKADLEKYYEPRQFKDMGGVYEQFIMSAQNAGMKPNVVKFNDSVIKRGRNCKSRKTYAIYSSFMNNSYVICLNIYRIVW